MMHKPCRPPLYITSRKEDKMSLKEMLEKKSGETLYKKLLQNNKLYDILGV